MQSLRLALVWLICAGGASLRALPSVQEVDAPVAAATDQDDVEAARLVLRGDTDSLTDLRKAVRTLVSSGQFGVLGEELRSLERTQVRVLIIEEMLLLPEQTPLRILDDVLPFLDSEDEALRGKAVEYVKEVHLGAYTTVGFNERLAKILVAMDVTEPVLRGAIIASGLEPSLNWIPALLDRWEQDPDGPCVPVIHQSLRHITMEDREADLSVWRQWQADNEFETREELLEDKYLRQKNENAELRNRVIRQTMQFLEKESAATLAEHLSDVEEEVRVFVANRLWEKANASNGDRDDTLEMAKDPIRQQLERLLEAGAQGPELRDLARAHAVLQAGEAEARDLLLRIFAVLDGDAQRRRQLLDSLQAVTGGKPDPMVAAALQGFLDQATQPEVRAAIWRVLGQVGEESTLVHVRAAMEAGSGTPAVEQEAALEAATQIALQAGEGAVCTAVYQDLCGYLERGGSAAAPMALALGLEKLSGLVAREARTQAFALLKNALQQNLNDKASVARYSESLCRMVGLEGHAVVALSEILREQAAGSADSVAVEPLLRRIKDLAARVEPVDMEAALPVLVEFLPEGGRAAPLLTQPARFASQALHEIETRHDAAELGAGLRRKLADLCEAAGRPGWTADFLRDVLQLEPAPVEPERGRLVWRRAQALMQTLSQPATSPGRAQEVWEVLVPLETSSDVARRQQILLAMVGAAELVEALAAQGAAAGERLLELLPKGDSSRSVLAQRVARLLLRAGQRKPAHDLIGKELADASSLGLDILRARASRHDDNSPDVVASSLDRYLALLGTVDRAGPVTSAHEEFASLLLDLVELLMLSGRQDDALTSLQRLPAEDQLGAAEVARLEGIRARLDQEGGVQPNPPERDPGGNRP